MVHQSSPLQSSSGLVPVGPHDLMDCYSISSKVCVWTKDLDSYLTIDATKTEKTAKLARLYSLHRHALMGPLMMIPNEPLSHK